MHKLHAKIKKQGPLSPKEAVVLRYLCEGYLRKEIADKVCRSYGCISKQIESIALKLGAHSSAEIVAMAVADNLVEIQISHQPHTLRKLLLVMLCLFQCFSMQGRRPPRPTGFRTSRTRIEYVG